MDQNKNLVSQLNNMQNHKPALPNSFYPVDPGYKYDLMDYKPADENAVEAQSLEFYKSEKKEGSTECEMVQNGTTTESVIEVCIHRLQHLNKELPCRETSCAITKLEEAKMWLDKRTEDRRARGVLGKHEK
jgi:hypothetical protein